MSSLLRLFTVPTSDAAKLQNFSLLTTEFQKVLEQFPSLSPETESFFILNNGEGLSLGCSFQGPLKPQDNALLEQGKVVDLHLKKEPGNFSEKELSELSPTSSPYLIQVSVEDKFLKLNYYSGEDIDL